VLKCSRLPVYGAPSLTDTTKGGKVSRALLDLAHPQAVSTVPAQIGMEAPAVCGSRVQAGGSTARKMNGGDGEGLGACSELCQV
jgi:hypothetical protein